MFNFLKRIFGSKEPMVQLHMIDGKLKVSKYNSAFVAKLRAENGDVMDGLDDEAVIKIFESRENITREPPRLEVIHEGIMADGTVAMKLDWNKAFIDHLREHGISGGSEEEAVDAYLQLLTRNMSHDDHDDQYNLTPAILRDAFSDIDRTSQAEIGEILANVQQAAQRTNKAN